MRFLTIFLTIVGMTVAGSSVAFAHGLPAGAGTIRLSGNTAYIIVTPDAVLFLESDSNANGTLEKGELSAQRKQVLRKFMSGFHLLDDKGRAGKVIFQDAGLSHHAGAERAHVRITLRYRWKRPPKQLRVRYDHAKEAPLQVRAQRFTAAKEMTKQKPVGGIQQHKLVSNRNVNLLQEKK